MPPGLSLRDWFAGQAVAGYLAGIGDPGDSDIGVTDIAACSYAVADALLTERAKARSGTDTGEV